MCRSINGRIAEKRATLLRFVVDLLRTTNCKTIEIHLDVLEKKVTSASRQRFHSKLYTINPQQVEVTQSKQYTHKTHRDNSEFPNYRKRKDDARVDIVMPSRSDKVPDNTATYHTLTNLWKALKSCHTVSLIHRTGICMKPSHKMQMR